MMNELFRSLTMNTKRCFLYLGGTASYFQLPPQWDDLVNKYVRHANEAGIPCVSGSAYDHLGIKKEGDPWHLCSGEQSTERLTTMLNDAVRCALEIWSYGSAKDVWEGWLAGEEHNVWRAYLKSQSPERDAPVDRGDVTPAREGDDSKDTEEKTGKRLQLLLNRQLARVVQVLPRMQEEGLV